MNIVIMLYFCSMQEQVNIKNKRARFEYELMDQYTAGIVLTGTEIKSIRAGKASIAESLSVYTHRQPALLEPILDAYTKQSGVEFKIVYSPKGLVQRLQSEGSATPADLVITVDINRVYELSKTDLLATLSSSKINKQINPNSDRKQVVSWDGFRMALGLIVGQFWAQIGGQVVAKCGRKTKKWRPLRRCQKMRCSAENW